MGLEDVGFDATVLCRFRRKLLDRGLERTLFERLVKAAREAGLLTKGAAQLLDSSHMLLDSSHILGAAGARDTYTLIRGGIRKLLRALGYASGKRGELSDRLWWYVNLEAPEKPQIDWGETEARTAHLREIVEDARQTLSLARQRGPVTPAANEAYALLSRSSVMMLKRARLPYRSEKVARPKRRKRNAGRRPRSRRFLHPSCVKE